MLKRFLTFSGITFLSRIFGFIRDFLMAYYFGASYYSDIFLVAFRIPNLFRSLVSEGSFGSGFVPLYKRRINHSDGSASELLNISFTAILIITLILCLCIQIFMPWFLFLIAPGFEYGSLKFDLTIFFARVMCPYVIFISLASILGSALQALNKFAFFAFSPLILNLCFIVSVYFFSDNNLIYYMSYSVLLAGILQLFWMFVAAYISGFKIDLSFSFRNNYFLIFLKRFIPSVLGMGASQLSVVINTFFASFFVGGVSFLYYAERIVQMPLALIGISINTVLLPMLCEAVISGDEAEAKMSISKALDIACFFCFPAAVGICLLSEPIVSSVFSYGSFSLLNQKSTSDVLRILAFGIPPIVCHRVFVTIFFAKGNVVTPAKVSLCAALFGLIVNLFLSYWLGYIGVAFAFVASAWLEFLILLFIVRKKESIFFPVGGMVSVGKVFVYNVPMILVLCFFEEILNPLISSDVFYLRVLTTLFLVLIGAISYFLTFYFCKRFVWRSV